MALKHSEFWDTDNVKTFRGFDVTNGEVELSNEEYGDYIDEIYEPVKVAGMKFNVSRILEELDPVAWRCGKGDYESELDSELQAAIDNEDDSEIEWIDDELEEDEERDEE